MFLTYQLYYMSLNREEMYNIKINIIKNMNVFFEWIIKIFNYF